MSQKTYVPHQQGLDIAGHKPNTAWFQVAAA
jgi:hypothetical protein